jgi:transposase-like protein
MKCPKCKKEKVYKDGFRPRWLRSCGSKHKVMRQAYVCDTCGHQWVDGKVGK